MNKNLDELFIFPRQLIDEESKSVINLVRQWAEKEILSRRMEYRENYSRLFAEKRGKLNTSIGLQWLTLPDKHSGFGWDDHVNAPGITGVLCETGRADASTKFEANLTSYPWLSKNLLTVSKKTTGLALPIWI